MQRESAEDLYIALGQSLAYEDLKGDFAAARQIAERWLDQSSSSADALIWRAIVHVLQGETSSAEARLDEAEGLSANDPNRLLRIVTYRLLNTYERFNSFPDGNGASATEISARWRGADDIREADTLWHSLIKQVTDSNVQDETWIVYGFLCNLKAARSMLEGSRFAPAGELNEQVLQRTLHVHEGLRTSAQSKGLDGVAAYPDWWSADLCRRAGDVARAEQLLERAETAFRRAGDAAGVAVCQMTRADWQCAPFSTPLAWNLCLQDSSSEGSHLSVTVESAEFSRPPPEAIGAARDGYAEAERRFQQSGAPRGAAAIQLRHGYLAMLDDNFEAAMKLARGARHAFQDCGDWRSFYIAQTHAIMAEIGLGRGTLALEPAQAIAQWGRENGMFSFTLGLGVLLNRWARHWLVRRGDFERALEGYRVARALFDDLGATANATQNVVDQGTVHQAIGERDAALTLYEEALDRYATEAEQRHEIADSLRQRTIMLAANVYQLCLQRTDADGMQRSADRLQQQVASLPGGADATDWLAALASGSTDLPAGVEFWALRSMAQSLIDQATVLAPLYRSRRAKDAGDQRKAERHWSEAESALAQVGDQQRSFLAVSVYAEKRMYERAADEFRRHLSRGGANAGFAGQITQLMQTLGGAPGQAESQLQQIRTHLQAFSVFVRVKAYGEAKSHLEALQRLAGDNWWSADSKPWQLLSDCGEMYEGLNEFSAALAHYDRAIEQLESRRQLLSRDELKTALAADKGAQYLYFQAARTAIKHKEFERAFDYAELGKARALLDLMAGSAAVSGKPEREPVEAQAWRQLNAQLALRRGLLAQERGKAQPDAQRIAQFTEQIAADESQMRHVEAQLARVFPSMQQAVSTTARTLKVAKIANVLPGGTSLVQYFFLGEELLIWTIDAQGLKQAVPVALDTIALARDIAALHRACKLRAVTGDLCARLSETFLNPVAATIRNCSRLMIVPYGAAHGLPFHALPFDGQPLGVSHTISYLPSASVLQFLPDPSADPAKRLLAVGNPTGDLEAAATEAAFVASLFDAELLLGEAATEDAVRQRIADCPLLHFATHGHLSAESPLLSSLVLAGGDELTLYELMGLRLDADLVVLSACSTGQGAATGGDDVLGLTRGLLAAGARAAIVSLWPVNDVATSLLMGDFYRRLRQGEPGPKALHGAQNYLRIMKPLDIDCELQNLRRDLVAKNASEALLKPITDAFATRVLAATAENESPGNGSQDFSHGHFWAPFVYVGR